MRSREFYLFIFGSSMSYAVRVNEDNTLPILINMPEDEIRVKASCFKEPYSLPYSF